MNKIQFLSLWLSTEFLRRSIRCSNINIQYGDQNLEFKKKNYFLYIHIPFCHEFCSFCSFHKFKYNEEKALRYFEDIKLNLTNLKNAGYDFSTLYVGGGTPMIHANALQEILVLAKELFNIKQISVETTPSHIDPNTLKRFQGLIDRLSIGIQSFDNEILKNIRRYDKYGSSETLQEKIANALGILPIVSLDMIFNLKNQTKEQLLSDIKIAKSLLPEQITMYPCMDFKLTNQTFFENFKTLKASKEFEFYTLIRNNLDGYLLNNAWAFAKEKNNISDEYVISNDEYIGVGSGAFSYVNGRLYINTYDLDKFHKRVQNNELFIIEAQSKQFLKKEKNSYEFMIHLFSGEFDINNFNARFDCDLMKDMKMKLFALEKASAIKIENNTIKPTRFGEFLGMYLMKEFYQGMDNIRAKLKKDLLGI